MIRRLFAALRASKTRTHAFQDNRLAASNDDHTLLVPSNFALLFLVTPVNVDGLQPGVPFDEIDLPFIASNDHNQLQAFWTFGTKTGRASK